LYKYCILSYCKTNKLVKHVIVKAYCLQLLTYWIGEFELSDSSVRELGLCWNDCFRRIFGYKQHEIKESQYFCGEQPFYLIYEMAISKWSSVTSWLYVCSVQFLCAYNSSWLVKSVSADSVGRMREYVRQFFANSVLWCALLVHVFCTPAC